MLALLALMLPGRADAAVSAVWQELAGSASGAGVSQAVSPAAIFDVAAAVGADGLPVVAYADYPDATASQGAITVKRWNGSTWTTLGAGTDLGQGFTPQVRVSPTGAISVAWLHHSGADTIELRLRTWSGTTWDELGGSDSAGGLSGAIAGITVQFSLALAGENPVVAFLAAARTGVLDATATPAIVDGTVQIYVRRWNGTAWEFVGSDFTGGGASNAMSFTTPAGTIVHAAHEPSLVVDEAGVPAVAFTYSTGVDGTRSTNTDVYVTRWNGSTWMAVGPAVPADGTASGAEGGPAGISNTAGASRNPSLAVAGAERLVLAWEEQSAPGPVAVLVRAWNDADSWTELAGSATGSGFTLPGTMNVLPQIGVDAAGEPIVAWQATIDGSSRSQIFVRHWNGSDAWLEMGLASASGNGISDAAVSAVAPALAVTPATGAAARPGPAVAWIDVGNHGPSQVFLRRFVSPPRAIQAVTQFHLSVAVAAPAGTSTQGTVGNVSGAGFDCNGGGAGGTCAADVDQGTNVVLQAAAQPGNRFLNWSGGPCGGRTNATCAFVATANVSTTALFRGVTGVGVIKAGSGTVTGPGFNCGGDCFQEIFTGTSVTLTPAPATGTLFAGWSGADTCSTVAANGACTFIAGGLNKSFTATFQPRPQQLTVTSRLNGNVTDGATIDCGSDGGSCAGVFDYGTPVTLQATANDGFMFVTWTGVSCAHGAANATCSFALKANTTVTPNYRARTVVSVVKQSNGSGTVSGPGLSCGLTCSAPMYDARLVTLSAAPATGSHFDGFAGACASATSPCSYVPSGANQTVTAAFTLNRYNLTVVNKLNGRVVSAPLPDTFVFNCGNGNPGCADTLDYGTPITLQATPIDGFVFTSWTGVACLVGGATNTSCSFILRGNTTVTPNYRARTFVGVAKPGNGTGTVSGPGISCGATCSAPMYDARPVTLRASPGVGSFFDGFDGACVSNTPSCTFVPAGSQQNVGATFRLLPIGVTVNVLGPGSVTGIGGAINCGAPGCSTVVDYGTPVTLVATPSSSPTGEFVGWTGCPSAGNTSCTLTTTTNRTVTATFQPTVVGVEVVALAVDSSIPLAKGAQRQYSAVGLFSDGTRRDVTIRAQWTSGNTSIVTVLPTSGLATAVGPGATSVSAQFRTLTSSATGSLSVSVDALQAAGITVSCAPYGEPLGSPLSCLPSGLAFEVECQAIGTFLHAGPQDITDQVTWSSSSTIARSLGLSEFNGPIRQSFQIVGVGKAALIARVTGVSSSTNTSVGSTWVVQGAPLVVNDVSVVNAPTGPLTPGVPVQLKSVASFNPISGAAAAANGCPDPESPPPRDFSLQTQWDSADDSVATVTFFGLVDPQATVPGSATNISWRYRSPGAVPLIRSGIIPVTVGP